MTLSRSIHVAAKSIIPLFFNGWVIFHYVSVPHLLYPFLCWWTFKLLPDTCNLRTCLGTVLWEVLVQSHCAGRGVVIPCRTQFWRISYKNFTTFRWWFSHLALKSHWLVELFKCCFPESPPGISWFSSSRGGARNVRMSISQPRFSDSAIGDSARGRSSKADEGWRKWEALIL